MGPEYSLLAVVGMAALLLFYHKWEEDRRNAGEVLCLEVILDEGTEIYGIHYEYYLGEKDLGGGNLQKDEPVPLAVGEPLPLARLAEGAFPKRRDMSAFALEFFVMGKDGVVKRAGERWEMHARFGRRYVFSICRDGPEGYGLKLAEDAPLEEQRPAPGGTEET